MDITTKKVLDAYEEDLLYELQQTENNENLINERIFTKGSLKAIDVINNRILSTEQEERRKNMVLLQDLVFQVEGVKLPPERLALMSDKDLKSQVEFYDYVLEK